MHSADALPLASRIAEQARARVDTAEVAEVRIGLGYTAVRLADGAVGVALTMQGSDRESETGAARPGRPGSCAGFRGRRPLAPRPAGQLLELLGSDNTVESAVGLACANALFNRPAGSHTPGDVLDIIALGPEDDVGMVGMFGPLLEPVRTQARSLTVFEQVARPRGRLRPAAEAPDVLPRCQVALITGTAIINGSIDGLLEAARSCREVVVLGASTPLAPGVFAGSSPVTRLCGVIVEDTAALLQIISEGGGMHLFKRYVRKVCVSVDSHPSS